MALDRRFLAWFGVLLFMAATISVSASPSSTYLSDAVLDSHPHVGRSLLQAKKGCSVNFEFLNYTIITSRCKGPTYPANLCCSAFKDLACPYADVLNDLTNECASTMFSYINLYGKYPPGLFSSECREGKLGLECPALSPSMSANDTNRQVIFSPSLTLMFTMVFLISWLILF